MNRIAFLLVLSLLFIVSCGRNRNTTTTVVDVTEINIGDSLRIQAGMGERMERLFEGVIPDNDTPGIEFSLVLYQQQYTNNGVYALTTTTLDERGTKSVALTTYGRWRTLLTNSHDIIELVPFDSQIANTSFRVLDEDRLRLLDQNLQPRGEGRTYDLVLRSATM